MSPRGGALAVGLATAVAVAACSSSGSSAKTAVVKVVSATLRAGTVQVQATSVTPTASGSETAKAKGSYNLATRQGTYTVDTGALLGTVEALATESTLYIRLPAAIAATLTGGKMWASADLQHPPLIPGIGNLPSVAGGADPTRALIGLQEGMTAARRVGAAAGVTHYQATVNLAKASSPLAASEITLLGGSAETDDVYVGGDGRIQRLVQSVRLGGGGPPEVVTTEFSSYGQPVSIAIPPASQTVDAAKLLGS